MTPYEVANSDALKTQIMETGEAVVGMWPTFRPMRPRIDQYVDAVRAACSDLGLTSDEVVMTLESHYAIKVTV